MTTILLTEAFGAARSHLISGPTQDILFPLNDSRETIAELEGNMRYGDRL